MNARRPSFTIRTTEPSDFPAITRLCARVYPNVPPWSPEALASHRRVFPEGQFVAVEEGTGKVLAMAASLVLDWDDYEFDTNWRDFTSGGTFANHDLENGRTLYAAEIMVDPDARGSGIGSRIYEARWGLVCRLGLLRIRAGARLRDYHRHSDELTPQAYVEKVVRGELRDRTLSFQLKRGFRVLTVVSGYLRDDPESLGYAAVIERLNEDLK